MASCHLRDLTIDSIQLGVEGIKHWFSPLGDNVLVSFVKTLIYYINKH